VSAVLGYLVFAALAIVGPGLALQRLLRLRIDAALVLPLGVAFVSAAYGSSLILGWPWLFALAVLGLDLSLLRERWPLPRAEGPSLAGAWPPLVACLVVLAMTEYGLNRQAATGQLLLDPVMAEDAAFHAGLTWELSQGYPPQVPGLSGQVIHYHFGLPLVRSAALRWAGVEPYDSLTRFDNTLGALALILVLRAAVRALGGSDRAVALAGWAPLATDLSFPLVWGNSVEWWVTLTKAGYFLFSLLQANSVVLALALALAAAVALARHLAGEGPGWLLLCAVLGAAAAFFKVFVAAQLLLGLGLAFLFTRSRRAALFAAIPGLLVLAWLVLGASGQSEGVFWDPLTAVRDVRQYLGLASAESTPPWGFVLLWVACSLGLRLVGLPAAWQSLRSGAAPGVTLATMALSGWPLGLLLRVSPLATPDKPGNEALYFFEQSGLVLWIFAALALGALRVSGVAAFGLGLLCAALAFPGTLQLVIEKAGRPPSRIPAEVVEALGRLRDASQPGDVVLQRPLLQRFPPLPVVLAGRRIPYTSYIPFFTQWATRAELGARLATVRRFFETTDPAEARAIARSLGARYLCLYGSDRVLFAPAGLLRPIGEESDTRVYEILAEGPPAQR